MTTTIEATTASIAAATVVNYADGTLMSKIDSEGRHLFFVSGDVYCGGGTRKGGMYVWADSTRAARIAAPLLYREKNKRELYVNTAYYRYA